MNQAKPTATCLNMICKTYKKKVELTALFQKCEEHTLLRGGGVAQ